MKDTMKSNKTILEWLNELPEPYKTQAIFESSKHEGSDNPHDHPNPNREVFSIDEALDYAFDWEESKDGFLYWDNLYSKLSKQSKNMKKE